MMTSHKKAAGRAKRKKRVRSNVFGEPERPRLSVYRSIGHVYAQIIDDVSGRTLAAASSKSKDISEQLKNGGNIAAAKQVGKLIGEKAKSAEITQVVFDRNGYKYHGRVKALADAAREAGLKF
jgi:large subunit ribosomal protein L18